MMKSVGDGVGKEAVREGGREGREGREEGGRERREEGREGREGKGRVNYRCKTRAT